LPAINNLVVTRLPNAGNTARIQFRFPSAIDEPFVRVFARRRDPVTSEFIDAALVDTGLILYPDASNNGAVEIPGLVTGSIVELVPFTSTGLRGQSVSAAIPAIATDPTFPAVRTILSAGRTYFVGFVVGNASFANGTPTVTLTGHGLSGTMPVVFTPASGATLPSNVTAGQVYYVSTATDTPNSFRITSNSNGSGEITFSGSSTGTISAHTGNDANPGFGTNGRSVALLTLQQAIDVASLVDSSIYNVTIQLCDGLHTHTGTINGKNMGGAGRIIIQGNTTTPANTIVRLLSGGVVTHLDFTGLSTIYDLRAFEVQSNQLIDIGIRCQGSVITIAGGFRFNAGTQKYLLSLTSQFGGLVDIVGDITVANTGTNAQFFTGETGTIRFFNPAAQLVVTIANTPTSPINNGFLFSRNGGVILVSNTLFNGNFAGNPAAAPVAYAILNGVINGTLLRGQGQTAFNRTQDLGGQNV
jgi:hypothetical protein